MKEQYFETASGYLNLKDETYLNTAVNIIKDSGIFNKEIEATTNCQIHVWAEYKYTDNAKCSELFKVYKDLEDYLESTEIELCVSDGAFELRKFRHGYENGQWKEYTEKTIETEEEIKLNEEKSEEPKWYFNVRSGSTFHDNDGAHIIAKDLSIPVKPHDFAGHPDDMAHIIFKDGVKYNAPCMDGSTYAFESEMYVGTSPENDGCDISKEAKFDILEEEEIVELEEDTGLDEL